MIFTLKKLFNFNEYHKLFEEFDFEKALSKKVDMNLLNMVFANVDLEKLLVNSTQIISILSSFFGKAGMRISLTLETLLLLYWIWKYENSTSADVKEDALIQLVFSAFGFAILGAGPAFKAISNTFSKGYKEYKLTGNVNKIRNMSEFKILEKNEVALKKAASTIEETLEKNLDKLPDNLVNKTTKKEIKETTKGVKKYVDELFEAENKTKPKKGLKNKLKKTGKLVKLGRKLFPVASYLLNRFLNKKTPEHIESSNNDFAILQYQIKDQKIIGAEFPKDLELSASVREDKNGKVIPTIIGVKILIDDIDNKSIIDNYNILTDLDINFQYYLMCATNGDPIYNNFKLFAVKGNTILISKRTHTNIEFVDAKEIIKDLRYVKLISEEEADPITQHNFEKVLNVYQDNLTITNSYTMWSKIIAKTFTREWWDKSFALKVSK